MFGKRLFRQAKRPYNVQVVVHADGHPHYEFYVNTMARSKQQARKQVNERIELHTGRVIVNKQKRNQ